MLLAIDIGNTDSVFALWDGHEFLGHWRFATNTNRTADQYYVLLSHLFAHQGIKAEIASVILSSTVPGVVFNLRVFCHRYFKCRPYVVGKSECALPIDINVETGTQVGPDRLVNSVGAYTHFGGDLIVVDFGTATTFDVVGKQGSYEGGVIAPGVNLSLKALHKAAAALPHVDITRPAQVIGKNTVACMQSGVFWGYVGLVREIVYQIKQEYPPIRNVIATGGLAPLFADHAHLFDAVELDLTMLGLVRIFNHNQAQQNHPFA